MAMTGDMARTMMAQWEQRSQPRAGQGARLRMLPLTVSTRSGGLTKRGMIEYTAMLMGATGNMGRQILHLLAWPCNHSFNDHFELSAV
jgi:hypothetical protein